MKVISAGSTVGAGRPPVSCAQVTLTVVRSAVTGTANVGEAQLPSYCPARGKQRPAFVGSGMVGLVLPLSQTCEIWFSAVPTLSVMVLPSGTLPWIVNEMP